MTPWVRGTAGWGGVGTGCSSLPCAARKPPAAQGRLAEGAPVARHPCLPRSHPHTLARHYSELSLCRRVSSCGSMATGTGLATTPTTSRRPVPSSTSRCSLPRVTAGRPWQPCLPACRAAGSTSPFASPLTSARGLPPCELRLVQRKHRYGLKFARTATRDARISLAERPRAELDQLRAHLSVGAATSGASTGRDESSTDEGRARITVSLTRVLPEIATWAASLPEVCSSWKRGCLRTAANDLLIRRHRRTVHNGPGVAACWADIPGMCPRVGSWLRPWQQLWQQSATIPQFWRCRQSAARPAGTRTPAWRSGRLR